MKELLYTKHNEKWTKKQLKFPISYTKKEVETIIDDKNFMDIYNDFNLQYLKEVVLEEKTQRKDNA